ncbi:hypothetical protein COCNU_scaffold011291G000010 [Cocos nucifera]|nr:hypothetical protein [Cocos nucifera]
MKVKRKVKHSSGENSGQEQDSLDDWEVIHSLMEGSVLQHIINKMVRKENVKRFDESFAAYLKVADLYQIEAFRALQEAQVEIEKVRAKVDCLKVASEVQTTEVEHLREVLRRKEDASTRLKVALTL